MRAGRRSWRRPVGPARPARPDVPDLSDRSAVHDCSWASARWAAEAELLLAAESRSRGAFTVRLDARSRAVLELVAPDDSHAPTMRPLREALPPQEIAALPMLPEAAARALPDLELLRAGLVVSDRLHPLVASALAVADSGPVTRSAPRPSDPHRVECRGEIHRIALRDGALTAVDHDPAQLRREELLVALGGPSLPCLRAIDAVHRDPEALPAIRERLGHGDVAGALNVVEALLGPGAVLRQGQLRDELESAAAKPHRSRALPLGTGRRAPRCRCGEGRELLRLGARETGPSAPARPPYARRAAPQADQSGTAPYRPGLTRLPGARPAD